MEKPNKSADATNSSPSRSPSRNSAGSLNSPRKSPGPQTHAQMEQLLVGADRLERMILAHELAINNDFKVQDSVPQQGTLEAKVRETIQQAFWDALQSSISLTPPDLTHALVLLEEIRETLLSFLPEGQGLQLRELIRQNLDIEHIKQQAAHDALDFREKAHFIISIMGRLCAPARDEEIKQLSTMEEIVPLFREVFRVLEEMKMDMLNFTLKQVRPIINQHSVEYEQQMFDEFLATQEEPLYQTKEWLRLTAKNLLETDEEPRNSAPPPLSNGSSVSWKVSPTRLLKSAFLGLLDWNPGPYPETLTADIPRIVALQLEVETAVLCASVLLVTWTAVGARLTSPNSPDLKIHLKNEILSLIKNRTEDDHQMLISVADHVLTQVQKNLPVDSQSGSIAEISGLKDQIVDLQRKDHPVRLLLMKRLKETIATMTTNTTPSNQAIPSALMSVQTEIQQIIDLFVRIVSRNQKVFGRYYSEIITGLADELGLRIVNSVPSSPSKQP